MKSPKVAVIDYGMGNLYSVRRALDHCGAEVEVTADHATILAAARVVLPGVGAFADAMLELRRLGLLEVTRTVAGRGTPLLGICLGMQLLLDESEEFGLTQGLGLIPGTVIPLPSKAADGRQVKIPFIGWNELVLPAGRAGWDGTVLQDVVPGEAVYFVHSFMAVPGDAGLRIADCRHAGLPVSAVIARDNIHGCQFHPEKSGDVGLRILRRFLM